MEKANENGHPVRIVLCDHSKDTRKASVFAQKTEKYVPTPVFKNGNIGEFQGYIFVPEYAVYHDTWDTWNERRLPWQTK